jgi:diguanylate cyclase (GGDEF)-like protein
MGTEIGARNFGDDARYDMLPEVAKVMGLETRSNRTLWRDRALVELNLAVLHSYQEAGVTIIDHHTASKHFLRHEEFERQAERPVPADWVWLVPPVSGSASPLFHREYFDTPLKPNYFYQPNPWAESLPYAAQQAAQEDPNRAERDALTGLLHRGALDCRLPRFGRDGGAIALLDLDGLAAINEEHGEFVGNALLRSAARALLGVVRPDDECARSGGDEFCVLLRGVESEADAIMVAERIRGAIGEVRVGGAAGVQLTLCVGLTLVAPGEAPSDGLRRAAQALAAAKAQGAGSMMVSDG